ncbi:hypothetical protein Tco_1342593 [Tanacetum coccineum]
MDLFPRLFAFETVKDYKIRDRWRFSNGIWGGNWEWRLPPRGRAIDDVSALTLVIDDLTLSHNETAFDSWSWTMDGLGYFKVKALTKYIQSLSLAGCDLGDHHVWNSWIPRKVNICVWRASLNRLATRASLSSRSLLPYVLFARMKMNLLTASL